MEGHRASNLARDAGRGCSGAPQRLAQARALLQRRRRGRERVGGGRRLQAAAVAVHVRRGGGSDGDGVQGGLSHRPALRHSAGRGRMQGTRPEKGRPLRRGRARVLLPGGARRAGVSNEVRREVGVPTQRPRVPSHRNDKRLTARVPRRRHPRVTGQAKVRVHQAPGEAQDVRVAGAARDAHDVPRADGGCGGGHLRGRHAGAAAAVRLRDDAKRADD